MASSFRDILEFFARVGIYDVVLPFLLVFTIVFAILEKTRVFGTEKTKDGEYTKKNLNSMAAFVIAFLVVASSRLVAVINQTMANMVLLLMLSVCFLILIGSFMKETKEGIFLEGFYKHAFMAIMFVGIVVIFLHALGWLDKIFNFLVGYYDSTLVGSIILMGIIVGFMWFITKEYKPSKA
ncbi:hypothetical protein HY772_05010 [Candidatus Woesearchaeota archaeon]|nr:hypothetical protein [Candidatus Woesearchaeota archaeon]